MTAHTKMLTVVRQETPRKEALVNPLDIFDKRIAFLETMHFDIGARLSKAKIQHLHTYNYTDIVPLEVDHTLIPA